MARLGIIRFRKKTFNQRENKIKDPKVLVYFLVFLYSLHLTPSLYIDSIFLEQFVGSDNVGYIYSFGSVLTILGLVISRRLLQFFGNYRTFKNIMLLNIITLAILSLHLVVETNFFWTLLFLIAFVLSFVFRTIGFLCMDIFLEHYSENSNTGGIRGIFLTSLNVAFMIGPFIAGILVTGAHNVARAYIWAILFAMLVLWLTRKYFKNFNDTPYEKSHIVETIFDVRKNPDLRKIFMCNLILRFFYASMVIYTPIFLHNHIGFNLSEVSLIIGISLIPFVILQIPMGKIADKKLGEQEMLTGGFIITAIATFTMTMFDIKIFALWAFILFMTRVGASAIELMTESYLFKKIDDNNINILGLYRVIRPTAYIVAPAIASLMLLWFEIPTLFLVVSFLLLWGLRYSLTIKDTL